MNNWTAADIPDLTGKVIIITGANSGLGYASALALTRKGGTVVMACRNLERGRQALAAIREADPQAQAGLIQLDLASLASIRAFAETFATRFDRLDVLMNNAGLSGIPRLETKDGFEMNFGVNHLGHFALTGRLLDVLLQTPGSRVVTVSSRMHTSAKMNWDDLMAEASYDKWDAYRQSKMANLLFALELRRRFEAAGASAVSLAAHPGFANTAWASNHKGVQTAFLSLASRLFGQSAEDGARSQLYAAAAPGAEDGFYYGPKGGMRGEPVETTAANAVYDPAAAERLWQVSEQLTGVTYNAVAESSAEAVTAQPTRDTG